MSRGVWVWDKALEKMVPAAEYYARAYAHVTPGGPMVMRDIDPYRSPETGEWITSRSQHRAHLKQHGLIEKGNERLKPRPERLPEIEPMVAHLYDQVTERQQWKAKAKRRRRKAKSARAAAT